MIRLHDALSRARLRDGRSADGDDDSHRDTPDAHRAQTDHLPGGPWAEDAPATDLRQLDPDLRDAPAPDPPSSMSAARFTEPQLVVAAAPRRRRAMFAVAGLAAFVALATYGAMAGSGAPSDTVTVARGDIHRVVGARGRVEPMAEVRLSASTLGRIAAVYVSEGDDVVEGQVLAQMDDSELRAQVAQAQARVEEALAHQAEVEIGARPQELDAARARGREAEAVAREAISAFERARRLNEGGIVSIAELDAARGRSEVATAQHEAARHQLALLEAGSRSELRRAALAQVKRARADAAYANALLAQTTVRAPISGKILHRFMNPGEVIALQRPQPIVTLADTRRIQVRAEVDETDARFVKPGQSAIVTSSAVLGREFKGTVIEIGTSAGRKSLLSENPAEPVDTKVVEVIIGLSDSYAWTFGTNVDASISVERRDNVVIVPQSAVRTADGRSVVTVRERNADHVRPVQVGAGDDASVEVVSGLREGEVVVR